MAIQLPIVKPIMYPAILNGQQNGRLPASMLWSTPGLAGGVTVRMVPTAARCWRAWTAAALKAGHTLKVTSSADSYRDYDHQLSTWLDRYEPDPFPGYIGTRWWPAHWDQQGRWVLAHLWYQRPGTAVAAYPGSSNHGWGIANDIGEERDTDPGAESLDDPTLLWMIATGATYGFSAEVQSERWHWRNYTGDNIPAAVLAYEQEQQKMTEQNQHNSDAYGVQTVKMLDKVHVYATPGAPAGTVEVTGNPLADNIRAIRSGVDELKARPPATVELTPEDRAAIVADLIEALTPVIIAAAAEAGVEARDAVADLGEGGAAQVRADADT